MSILKTYNTASGMWEAIAVQGPTGATGATGATGPIGASGASGAAGSGGGATSLYKIASSNPTYTSATLTYTGDLTLSLTPAGTYLVRYLLTGAAPLAAGFNYKIDYTGSIDTSIGTPAVTSIWNWGTKTFFAEPTLGNNVATSPSQLSAIGTDGNFSIEIQIWLKTSTAGNLRFFGAQQTANASAAYINYASSIVAERIA